MRLPRSSFLLVMLCSALFLLPLLAGATADLNNGAWSAASAVMFTTPEAAMMVRVGDIDNFGCGYPAGQSPFQGQPISYNSSTMTNQSTDPPGTDCVQVPSCLNFSAFTSPNGLPCRPASQPISMNFTVPSALPVTGAVLQLYLGVVNTSSAACYQVTLNGTRLPGLETLVNSLEQTSEGQLLTYNLPSTFLPMVQQGNLKLVIDDPTTAVTSYYCLDFIKLLLNPTGIANTGQLTGIVHDRTEQPVVGAQVYANGFPALDAFGAPVLTDAGGNYTFYNAPPGLVQVTLSNANRTVPYLVNVNTNANQQASANPTVTNILANQQTTANLTGAQLSSIEGDESAWVGAALQRYVDNNDFTPVVRLALALDIYHNTGMISTADFTNLITNIENARLYKNDAHYSTLLQANEYLQLAISQGKSYLQGKGDGYQMPNLVLLSELGVIVNNDPARNGLDNVAQLQYNMYHDEDAGRFRTNCGTVLDHAWALGMASADFRVFCDANFSWQSGVSMLESYNSIISRGDYTALMLQVCRQIPDMNELAINDQNALNAEMNSIFNNPNSYSLTSSTNSDSQTSSTKSSSLDRGSKRYFGLDPVLEEGATPEHIYSVLGDINKTVNKPSLGQYINDQDFAAASTVAASAAQLALTVNSNLDPDTVAKDTAYVQDSLTIASGVADAITGIVSSDPTQIINGVMSLLNGVFSIAGTAEGGAQPPTLTDVLNAVNDMHADMTNHFDQVDHSLDNLTNTVNTDFTTLSHEQQFMQQDVENLQSDTVQAISDLNCLNQNTRSYVAALSNADLQTDVLYSFNSGQGGYTLDFGGANSFAYFTDKFYDSSVYSATDSLHTNPATYSSDANIANDLTDINSSDANLSGFSAANVDYDYEVNYLNSYAQHLTSTSSNSGGTPLVSGTLQNPSAWATGAECALKVATDSPWYAARMDYPTNSSARHITQMIGAGQSLQTAFHNISMTTTGVTTKHSEAIFTPLLNSYITLGQTVAQVVAAEAIKWKTADANLHGFDLWKGNTQTPLQDWSSCLPNSVVATVNCYNINPSDNNGQWAVFHTSDNCSLELTQFSNDFNFSSDPILKVIETAREMGYGTFGLSMELDQVDYECNGGNSDFDHYYVYVTFRLYDTINNIQYPVQTEQVRYWICGNEHNNWNTDSMNSPTNNSSGTNLSDGIATSTSSDVTLIDKVSFPLINSWTKLPGSINGYWPDPISQRNSLVTLCQQHINNTLQAEQVNLYTYLASDFLPSCADAQEFDAFRKLLYCYAGLGLDSLLLSDFGMNSVVYGNWPLMGLSAWETIYNNDANTIQASTSGPTLGLPMDLADPTTQPNTLNAQIQQAAQPFQKLLTNTIYPGIDNGTLYPSNGMVDKTLRKLEAFRDSEFALAGPASYCTTEHTALTVPTARGLMTCVTQQLGVPLTVVMVSPPVHGTLTLATDGSFTYTPYTGFSGTDIFTYNAVYTATENGVTYVTPSDPAAVTITVAAPSPTVLTYSGHVWLKTDGAPAQAPTPAVGVSVAANDGSASTTTDSTGAYSLARPLGWAGYITLPQTAVCISTGAFSKVNATTFTQDFTLLPNWNVATEYSNTQNPTGAWTYGWQSSTVPFQPFTVVDPASDIVDYLVWSGHGMQLGRKLTDTTTLANVSEGELTLQPMANAAHGECVVARWTAPIDGTFAVFGYFGLGTTGQGSVGINLMGQSIFSAVLNNANTPYNLLLTMKAGEVLDFYACYASADTASEVIPLAAEIRLAGWDVTADYNGTMNSTDAWTYGELTTPGYDATFQGFSCRLPTPDGIRGMCDEVTGAFLRLNSTATATSLGEQPGTLNLVSGQQGQPTVVRWSSPVSGTFQLTGDFGAGGDYYQVLQNGQTINGLTPTGGQPFSQTLTVNANDSVDFITGNNTGTPVSLNANFALACSVALTVLTQGSNPVQITGPITVNTPVTLSAVVSDPACTTPPSSCQYQFWASCFDNLGHLQSYPILSGSATDWTQTTSATWNLPSSASWTPTTPASYTLHVAVTYNGNTSTGVLGNFIVNNPLPLPTITSFTPTSGSTGTVVTLNGTNLANASAVTIGGTAATITADTATSITVNIGNGSTGIISVTTPGGTATSNTSFTFLPPISAVQLTVSPSSPVSLGTPVTLSATTTGGCQPEYEFYALIPASNNQQVMIQSYSLSSTCTWTPVIAATYTLFASAREHGSTGSYAADTSLANYVVTSTPAPAITSFTPTSGSTGTVVTLTGSGFTGATAVAFGGTAATSFSVVSSTTITAQVAAGASGAITVTTPSGTATSSTTFTFVPPISAVQLTVTPPSPVSLGTPVTLSATTTGGYQPEYLFYALYPVNGVNTTVMIQGNPLSSTCSWTPAVAATYTLVVRVREYGSSGSYAADSTLANYTISAIPAPTITAFTPTSGSTGTIITITGANFTGATTVAFGGSAAQAFTVVNNTTITAQVGAGASGAITVTTPGGTATSSTNFSARAAARATGAVTVTSPTSRGAFTFLAPISAVKLTVTPPSPVSLGTPVTLCAVATGGYQPEYEFYALYRCNNTNTTMMIRNYALSSTCTWTPALATTYTIVVCAREHGSTVAYAADAALGYLVKPMSLPTITSFTPTSGGTGTVVTITGAGFTRASAVAFGGVAAKSVTFISATSITATVGSGATGQFTVTTPGGTATSSGIITLAAPEIGSSSTPASPSAR